MNGTVGRCAAGWRVCAVSAILAGATACVHYVPQPLEPAGGASDFASRRLSEPALRAAVASMVPRAANTWPLPQWDRAELLAVALVRNPQLAVARAEVNAALAHQTAAGERPNPDLTLQSEYARNDAHPWLYGLSLSWLLRSGERRRIDEELARLETDGARWQLMDETWAVRRALIGALSDWEEARRGSALLDRLAAAQDRVLSLEQRRVDAGEDPPVELIGSRQARLEVEQQRLDLRAQAAAARSAAAAALGLPAQALDELEFAWPEWGAPATVDENTERDARERALLSRADLGMAIADYSRAEAKLKLSIARQYPEFVLEPGYYWDHGIAKFPFDVGFTLPFNGNRGEIAEARSGRELAGRRMLAVQALIYDDIAGAERAERVARAAAAGADGLLQEAQRRGQQAELGQRLGATGQQERIAAEISAARAELDVVHWRARLQSARNALEDALHCPLSGPELAMRRPES